MSADPADLAHAGSKRMPFQRDPESVSPRGVFDDVMPKGSRRFLMAAVSAFAGRGYHATTTRDIASLAGSSPAGIYTYYSTKADLLFEISVIAHDRILSDIEEAVASADDPIGRVAAMVRASVLWHAEEHVLARVVNADFRALDVTRVAKILKIRRTISQIVRNEVQLGVDAGVFSVDHIEGTAIAMLRLMDVAPWYNERGPMSPSQLADVYVELILKMLGASTTRRSDDAGDRDTAING
ncbi:TetR/AcrR family transcriptional regulator [Aeromicrobium panaciterrae]|uniref:TetR/AcrR family transcriptional regulator n=1 Tax=Aeromicrobium panaciterrae TaxID=363861 RepID=UPI0031DA9367